MKRFLILFLILFVGTSYLFAWVDVTGSTIPTTSANFDVKDIQNDVYDQSLGAINIKSLGATTYITISQLELLQKPTIHIRPDQMNLLQYPTNYMTVSQLELLQRPTTYVSNFPTDYPDASAASVLSSIESNQALLQRPTVHVDAPITVKDDRYENKVSTWVGGSITSATSATLTVPAGLELVEFSIVPMGTSGVPCGNVASTFGAGKVLFGKVAWNLPLSQPESSAEFYLSNLLQANTYTYEFNCVK